VQRLEGSIREGMTLLNGLAPLQGALFGLAPFFIPMAAAERRALQAKGAVPADGELLPSGKPAAGPPLPAPSAPAYALSAPTTGKLKYYFFFFLHNSIPD
jgi:hypothetical protein